MSSRPGFLCPYCGQHKLGAERSTEHVLPAALGCELTTAEVCHDCNQRAGREIDDPFCRELWMHEMRHRHQVPDRRGDVPGPPVVSGTLKSDGSRILAILDRGGWWAKVIPTEEWTDAKTLQFRVDPADAPEAVAKKLNRLQKSTGKTVSLASQVPSSEEHPEVELKIKHSIVAWPRMGLKVALAVARRELDDTFLLSPAADWMRRAMWGDLALPAPAGVGVNRHVLGEALDETSRLAQQPPEHQLMLLRGRNGVGVMYTLFGEVRYGVQLGPSATITAPTVWLLEPIGRTVNRLTWVEWESILGNRLVAKLEGGKIRPPSS